MPLPPGSRLAAYEVLSPLGAGGMGEVYRARDTRLGREVAIKVISAERLADENHRRRFLEEAKALSSLDHPHIVTIHEIDSVGGLDFMVMEFVRGTSLDALIPTQGLRLHELLTIAISVADALAAAHARNIIHRDLKPANVIVGEDGLVKVLDFGLARQIGREEGQGHETLTDVGSIALTSPGRIAGTAAYMSPEQASGGRIDARSDIFAFGATLYEMATGVQAFAGNSTSDTLAAVLQARPVPPRQVVSRLPRELERLILRCLRREPHRRYQTMLDVRLELQEIKEESDSGSWAPARTIRRHRRRAASVAGAGLTVAAAATWLFWGSDAVDSAPPIRVLPLTTFDGNETFPTVSPDGDQVAFTWNGDGKDNFDIYVTIVGSAAVHRLTTDPADDVNPSWSPDGRHIAFVRRESAENSARVYLTSPLGGDEWKLSDLPVPFRGFEGRISWSADGRYIAAARSSIQPGEQDETGESTGIHLIPTRGGAPRILTNTKAPASDRDPAFSPDGGRLAYLACNRADYARCDVMALDLDADLATTGAPRRLTSLDTQMIGLAWVRDGTSLVFGTEAPPLVHNLWRVDSDGRRTPERVEVAGRARHPASAPSRDRLVFARSMFDTDVYAFEATGTVRPRIASTFPDGGAAFSPDGTRIVFTSSRSGEAVELWIAGADGSGARQLTRHIGRFQAAPGWAPDGRAIAFSSQAADGHWHIWKIDADGGNPRQITTGPGDQFWPTWSRDGRRIYFTLFEDAGPDVWRVAVAGGHPEQMTRDGGLAGFESVDGTSLLYLRKMDGGRTPLVIVPLTGGPRRQLAGCVQAFTVAPKGAYYYPCSSITTAAPLTRLKSSEVRLVDPATGQDTLVAMLADVFHFEGAWRPAVSPDGATILYTRVAREGEDLMLIENFR